MCGRYKLSAVHKDVQKHFDLIDAGFEIIPSEEIFPGTDILAVHHGRVPEIIHWTIEDRDNSGVPRRAINAKCETITKVEMFKDAFKEDRVLIPANSFYEWKDTGARKKQRYEFEFDEPLFAFAGIARECEIKGHPRNCGVIITTVANDAVKPIHSKPRMPVIVHKYDWDKWTDPDTPFDELRRIMQPVPPDEIRAHEAVEPERPGSLPLFEPSAV